MVLTKHVFLHLTTPRLTEKDEGRGKKKRCKWPVQLIFKLVHFVIAVIMMQHQLSVATQVELHIKKSLLYNAAKRPALDAYIYLTCFAYDLFFPTKQLRFIFLSTFF